MPGSQLNSDTSASDLGNMRKLSPGLKNTEIVDHPKFGSGKKMRNALIAVSTAVGLLLGGNFAREPEAAKEFASDLVPAFAQALIPGYKK